MNKIYFQKLSAYEPVTIFGHTFKNADDILHAVTDTVDQQEVKPDKKITVYHPWMNEPVPGIYIANIYTPLPCFDSFDRCYEDRDYVNFYFSRQPFTEEQLDRLARQELLKDNGCLIAEGMSDEFLPAIYRDADHPTMTLATATPYQPDETCQKS